jgi:hypothetical protein
MVWRAREADPRSDRAAPQCHRRVPSRYAGRVANCSCYQAGVEAWRRAHPDHTAAYAGKQAVAVILAAKEKFLLRVGGRHAKDGLSLASFLRPVDAVHGGNRNTKNVRAMVGGFRPASNEARRRFAFPSGISANSAGFDTGLDAGGAGALLALPVEVPCLRLAISASTAACSR